MATIKFTIEKTEKREVEFEAPCYRKTPDKHKIFKIISQDEIYELYLVGEEKFSIFKWSIIFSDVKESVPATEQEWISALKTFADYWGQFACNQGLTECGYPEPEPEEEKSEK